MMGSEFATHGHSMPKKVGSLTFLSLLHAPSSQCCGQDESKRKSAALELTTAQARQHRSQWHLLIKRWRLRFWNKCRFREISGHFWHSHSIFPVKPHGAGPRGGESHARWHRFVKSWPTWHKSRLVLPKLVIVMTNFHQFSPICRCAIFSEMHFFSLMFNGRWAMCEENFAN